MSQLRCRNRKNAERGFTLLELVVVLAVIGLLAAIAVPRFVDSGRNARLAALDTLAAGLLTATTTVRALCPTNSACNYAEATQQLTIAGRPARLNYGWLDAGDDLNGDQIDTWVNHAGFSATLPDIGRTRFALDDAPDPANCSVTYWDAFFRGPVAGIDITKATSGC